MEQARRDADGRDVAKRIQLGSLTFAKQVDRLDLATEKLRPGKFDALSGPPLLVLETCLSYVVTPVLEMQEVVTVMVMKNHVSIVQRIPAM